MLIINVRWSDLFFDLEDCVAFQGVNHKLGGIIEFALGVFFQEILEEFEGLGFIFQFFGDDEGFHEGGAVVVGAIGIGLYYLVIEGDGIFEIALPGGIIGHGEEVFGLECQADAFRVFDQAKFLKQLLCDFFLLGGLALVFEESIDAGFQLGKALGGRRGVGKGAEKDDIAALRGEDGADEADGIFPDHVAEGFVWAQAGDYAIVIDVFEDAEWGFEDFS